MSNYSFNTMSRVSQKIIKRIEYLYTNPNKIDHDTTVKPLEQTNNINMLLAVLSDLLTKMTNKYYNDTTEELDQITHFFNED